MRTLRIVLFILGVFALGCRTDPNQVLLERDLRLQEDKIYELEAMLEDCHASREATIRENKALKKELAGGDRGPGADSRSPSVELPALNGPPERRPRRDEAPKLEPPTIELPEPSSTPPPEMTPGHKSAMIGEGPPTQLVINKRLTGGINRGSEPGSEGILVAFEPRDAAGHLVKGPGAVSVVVLDPALDGEAGRVARWDFEPHEVPSHFHNTVFGRGLQFELPWPGEPPKNRDLRLFVRFTTPEGKKIVAETNILVRTPENLPRLDRQTKNRSATESASRPRRTAEPASRLKSPRVTLSEPREIAPADQNEALDTPEDSQPVVEPEASEPPQQATRPDRPLWKPYR
jgi:hypothetical protein